VLTQGSGVVLAAGDRPTTVALIGGQSAEDRSCSPVRS